MKLVISAATKISDVQILERALHHLVEPSRYVRAVLVTPLFVSRRTLTLCRRIRDERGIPVMFDSGGYAVQTGKVDFFEMYAALLDVYARERWADLYTLPDNVPTTNDTPDAVEGKVRQTTDCVELFLREMPAELRDRALAVAHGRTMAQLEYCLERYLHLGLHHIGFGSFGTAGQNNSMNVATIESVANARSLTSLARQRRATVHLFGIGAPALLPWIAQTGATSFDSANWARSAGFGQVFLPLTRGYNVSYRANTSTIQCGLGRVQFEHLKKVTGHECDYCFSFERLQASREARAAHNLYATFDALGIIGRGDRGHMEAIYAAASPKYRTLWKRWVGPE